MIDHAWSDAENCFLEYCKTSKNLSRNTLNSYRQDLNELSGYSRDKTIEAFFTPESITAYVAYLRDVRALKPATIKLRIACVRTFSRWLEKRQLIESSPFRQLDLQLRIPRRLPRSLNRDHLTRIARYVATPAGNPAERGRPAGAGHIATTALAIKIMLATGVRVGELTSLDIGDVSNGGTNIRIFGKGSRERVVYIGNARLAAEIASHISTLPDFPAAAVPLFVNSRGKRLSPQALRLRLRRLSSDLDIAPHVTPHRFRHTAATTLIEEGIDIRLVQRLLGHSSIATTEIYTHVSDRSLKAAVEAADTIGKIGF